MNYPPLTWTYSITEIPEYEIDENVVYEYVVDEW